MYFSMAKSSRYKTRKLFENIYTKTIILIKVLRNNNYTVQ